MAERIAGGFYATNVRHRRAGSDSRTGDMGGWSWPRGASPAIASADSDGLAMVDPELREGAKLILPALCPIRSITRRSLECGRKRRPPAALPSPAPAVELRRVPGAQGQPDVGVAVIGARRDGVLRPAVLHIHGGGFVVGRMEDTFPASQTLAEELDCVVVKSTPTHPRRGFPGRWRIAMRPWSGHANAEALGVDRDRIAIKGESAGGGLPPCWRSPRAIARACRCVIRC
jgi:acetyl esterase/lipase